MGSSISKNLNDPASAGLTADSIERFYDSLARKRREREEEGRAADNSFEGNGGAAKDDEEKKREEDSDNDDGKSTSDTCHCSHGASPWAAASVIVDSTEVDPGDIVAAKVDLDAAFRAIQRQDKDSFDRAITSLTKLGLELNQMAKVVAAWVKEHPYLTAAIVVSIILFACTPAIIGAAGFGAGGIVAGRCAC